MSSFNDQNQNQPEKSLLTNNALSFFLIYIFEYSRLIIQLTVLIILHINHLLILEYNQFFNRILQWSACYCIIYLEDLSTCTLSLPPPLNQGLASNPTFWNCVEINQNLTYILKCYPQNKESKGPYATVTLIFFCTFIFLYIYVL